MTTKNWGGKRDNRKQKTTDERGGLRNPPGGRPKAIRLYVETVVMACPYCEQTITDPHVGSELITRDEYAALPDKAECQLCGKVVHKARWPTK